MECYKELAEVYDELINQDIDYKKWCEFILMKCKQLKVYSIDYLDLACGTGNFTVELCGAFKHTWAVDLSCDMLTKAEEKIRKAGAKAKFVCQDISNLKLNHKFDLISCCLDSTNYILDSEKLKKFFQGVFNLLKDNGLFVFDINSYYKLTEILGNNTFTYDDDELVYIWENYLENDIVDMNLTFFIKHGQVYERFDETHLERAYKERYIEEILQAIGFKIEGKFDNYTENPVKDDSERIVYIVRKNNGVC